MSVTALRLDGQGIGSATPPSSGFGIDVDTGSGTPFVINSAGVTTLLGGAVPATATPATLSLGGSGIVGTATKYAREDHAHPVNALTDTTHGARGGGTGLHPDATVSLSGFLTPAQFTKLSNLSNTNSGDVTLTAVGSSPSANGASLSGQALTLQPADNTTPGLLTAGAQPIGGIKTFSSTIVGSVSGNAGTATVLQTARNINGVSFDGSAAITVTADANTLTNTTLKSTVVSSSLTSVGTLAALTVTATIVGSITGNAATATLASAATALATPRAINGVNFDGTAPITVTAAAGTLTGGTLAAGVTASSLTSVGTLAALTVTATITGSITGNAGTATALQTARAINGVNFDGTAAITVAAAASTLTGTTLASGVTASSLTSVGTLAALTVTATISGSVSGNAGTATALQTARTINGVSFNGTANITIGADPTGVFNVATYGATGNGTTTDQTAVNLAIAAANAYAGIGAFGARGATVYFPPGVFNHTAGWTAPTNGVILKGAGRGATTILVNFATGDLLAMTSGSEFCEIRDMQFFGGVTRTSGAYINTNGANDVLITNFSMTGAFEGIVVQGSSIKVTVKDGLIDSCTATTGTAIRVENGAAGDTYIGPYLILSNPSGSKPLAGIRVRQSGHFEIRGVNATSCDTGLLIDPAAGQDVTYGFLSDSLFDSCGTNGGKINPANSATARVRSLKFTDVWFSGAGAAAGLLLTSAGGSAIVDDLEFVAGRYLNNGTHGVQHAFGTNVRFIGGTYAGNSVASSGVSDGINIAAGITDFMVTDGRSGPIGTASNTQRWGCLVAAGASNRYTITGNDFSGNLTGGLSDGGTGGTKNVSNNLPYLTVGGLYTMINGGTTAGVADQIFATSFAAPIPAGAPQVGTALRVQFRGQTAASGNITYKLHFGPLGTVADATILTIGAITSAAAAQSQMEAHITFAVVGASGTIRAYYTNVITAGVLLALSGQTVTTAVNMNVANILTLSVTMSASTMTALQGTIEVVKS